MPRGRETIAVDAGWSDDESSSSLSDGSLSSSSSAKSASTEELPVRNQDKDLNDRFSAFRRRGKIKSPFDSHSKDTHQREGKGKASNSSRNSRLAAWERTAHRRILSFHRVVSEKCPLLVNRTCNVVLFLSLLFWMVVGLWSSSSGQDAASLPKRPSQFLDRHTNKHFDKHRNILRKGQAPQSHGSIFSDAAHGIKEMYVDGFNRMVGGGTKKAKKKEADLPGCERPKWHSHSFPNCNDVHGINLSNMIVRGAREKPKQLGYVGSGLWRSVFAVAAGAGNEKELSVLKVMKEKHEVDKRNFDRHRRDAIVMERLSGSPNVVDIFGFCGNTVLTEFIPKPLDHVIYAKAGVPVNPLVETPNGRLNLAIGVMKGLAALHEVEGGPIVHADVQSGQFLVSPSGDIKVNDFNRCRFMAHYKTSGASCKFAIPTAPGKNRSPEEYKEDYLDEKLDVYSGANILYGIITGQRAWSQFSSTDTKKYVKEGAIPFIPNEFRQANPLNAALANVTELAYEVDPAKRISAREAVIELERARDRYAN